MGKSVSKETGEEVGGTSPTCWKVFRVRAVCEVMRVGSDALVVG